jgi:DNA gyrase/topoisomerase IV subunit A
VQGRNTQGVRIMNVKKDERVVAVDILSATESTGK